MTGKRINLKKTVFTLLAILLIIFSHYWLDRDIARFFGQLLKENSFFSRHVSDIPDFLFPVALVCTVTSWIAYFYLDHNRRGNAWTRFFDLTRWTVPFAFMAKLSLKEIFGVVTTRKWLQQPELFGFHWFHGGMEYGGFPSGHMAVFTVLVIAFWRFFPKTKYVGVVVLIVTAVALIVTSYHFVSDVIAGALAGFLVDWCTYYLIFRRCRRPCHRQNEDRE